MAWQQLRIQVVRALTRQAFWKSLERYRQVFNSGSVGRAADTLKAAIEHKVKRINAPVRPRLTLALDASDVPGLSFDAVVDAFNARHGVWMEAQGFRAVWVVGPQLEMVHRFYRGKASQC